MEITVTEIPPNNTSIAYDIPVVITTTAIQKLEDALTGIEKDDSYENLIKHPKLIGHIFGKNRVGQDVVYDREARNRDIEKIKGKIASLDELVTHIRKIQDLIDTTQSIEFDRLFVSHEQIVGPGRSMAARALLPEEPSDVDVKNKLIEHLSSILSTTHPGLSSSDFLEQNDFVPAVEQYHDTLGRLVTVTHDPRKQATPEYINQTLDSIEQLKTNVNAKIPYHSALDTGPPEETKTPEPLPSSKSNWPSIIQNAIDNLSKFLSHLKISRVGKYVSDILASVNRATKSFTKASGTGSVKGAVQKPPDKGPK
ncbi:MAG: hypothetical protein VXY77_04985 [Pseudomonadota bacterium]|nr:hypothetical protein [Pseudomonadota bacterium]